VRQGLVGDDFLTVHDRATEHAQCSPAPPTDRAFERKTGRLRAVPLKDWLFIIGVVVVTLVAVAAVLPDSTMARYKKPEKRNHRASAAGGFYALAVLDLLCITRFLDFRLGFVVNLGLPEVWSWILAPIGLLLLVVASIVAWAVTYSDGRDNVPRWRWLVAWAILAAAYFGYITIGFGPSAWFRSE
jgi:hypothetical protein